MTNDANVVKSAVLYKYLTAEKAVRLLGETRRGYGEKRSGRVATR